MLSGQQTQRIVAPSPVCYDVIGTQKLGGTTHMTMVGYKLGKIEREEEEVLCKKEI